MENDSTQFSHKNDILEWLMSMKNNHDIMLTKKNQIIVYW